MKARCTKEPSRVYDSSGQNFGNEYALRVDCLIDGCDAKIYCKKLCKRHYGNMAMRRWRAENPEKYRLIRERGKSQRYEYQKRWLKDNVEKRRAYIRNRYRKNIEENRAYQREYKRRWRKLNPEKTKLADQRRSLESKARRREKTRIYNKAHRAERLLRNVDRERAKSKCHLSKEEKTRMSQIYKYAHNLRSHGLRVQVDHKIPLSKGGLHHPNNLQIIPKFENGAKHCNADYK